MPLSRPQQEAAMGINNMSPLADEAPPATPNFVSRQGYLNASPEGIDVPHAWTFKGGTGSGINIIDLEWGWNFSHIATAMGSPASVQMPMSARWRFQCQRPPLCLAAPRVHHRL